MKTIYILHGWTYTTEKWKPFIKLLEEKGMKVVLLKIPGLTAPLDTPWTLNDYVNWLKEILDGEKERIVLLGHSNGGRIASAYAARYSAKIARLILIDSAGIANNSLFMRLKRLFFKSLALIGRQFTSSEIARKLLYRLAGEYDYHKANTITKAAMLNFIASDMTTTAMTHYFSKIGVATLIIWGEKDHITPLSDGKKIHCLIRHSQLVIVAAAGHSPQYTHEHETTRIICQFLTR